MKVFPGQVIQKRLDRLIHILNLLLNKLQLSDCAILSLKECFFLDSWPLEAAAIRCLWTPCSGITQCGQTPLQILFT